MSEIKGLTLEELLAQRFVEWGQRSPGEPVLPAVQRWLASLAPDVAAQVRPKQPEADPTQSGMDAYATWRSHQSFAQNGRGIFDQ